MKMKCCISRPYAISFVLLCTLLLGTVRAWAQSRLPAYRMVHSPEKLAARITRGLASDSDKAVAIHEWITHHIRYDVKKANSNNFSPMSPEKILRKRKAICVGYSDLYDALCLQAGLKSVTVLGYSKNTDVDIVDTFYLDDHSWNATLLNGQWLLTDACWDAGYVYYKRSLLQAIFSSLTHSRHYKSKPHFKRKPVQTYCLKNGPYFSGDHLAVIPLWQLQQPVMSIEAFRQDSTYYYKRAPRMDSLPLADGQDARRLAYYELSKEDKYVYSGKLAYDFNTLNHYHFANSRLLHAVQRADVLNTSGPGAVALAKTCDTILNDIKLATTHFDSNAVCIARQRESLTQNNHAKMDTFRNRNGKLLASTKNVLRQSRKTKKVCAKSTAQLKKMAKSNRSFAASRFRNRVFGTIRLSKVARLEDSASYRKELAAVEDSINAQRALLTAMYSQADSMCNHIFRNNARYLEVSANCTYIGKALTSFRVSHYDDYDYEIRYVTDTLIALKLPNDSLLFEDGVFRPVALNGQVRHINKEILKYRAFIGAKLQLVQKLKRASRNVGDIASIYDATLQDEMAPALGEYEQAQAMLCAKLKQVAAYAKYTSRAALREVEAYALDQDIAKDNFTQRNKAIVSDAAAFTKLSNQQKAAGQRIQAQVEKYKQKLAGFSGR